MNKLCDDAPTARAAHDDPVPIVDHADDSPFFRGLLIGLPLSLVLWVAICWAAKVIL